jgi:IstB-like ATP binding protein
LCRGAPGDAPGSGPKRYFHCALLIIDAVRFRPLERAEATLFFRLVSARYEKGSIVLTSNKHVRDWPAIFAGDEILTTAVLDRPLHHVHIISIDGRSYRLRELGALLGTAERSGPCPSLEELGRPETQHPVRDTRRPPLRAFACTCTCGNASHARDARRQVCHDVTIHEAPGPSGHA